MPVIADYVTEVRRQIDEMNLSGESVATDTDVLDSASSNFSDVDIQDRLMDGSRYVASRVAAQYIPSLIISITPTDFNVPYSSSKKVIRLLGSRVSLTDGTKADRRTRVDHRKKESSGLNASSTNPVYIFEDFLFEIYDGTLNPVGAVGYGVKVPDSTTDVLNMGELFRNAIIQYAVSSCFISMGIVPLASVAKKNLITSIAPYLLKIQNAGSN